MPVFINEVVIRSSVERPAAASGSQQPPAASTPVVDREALVDEVTRRVLEHLEHELDRLGER